MIKRNIYGDGERKCINQRKKQTRKEKTSKKKEKKIGEKEEKERKKRLIDGKAERKYITDRKNCL